MEQLGKDLWLQVFQRLDTKTLLSSVPQVCKNWQKVWQTEAFWWAKLLQHGFRTPRTLRIKANESPRITYMRKVKQLKEALQKISKHRAYGDFAAHYFTEVRWRDFVYCILDDNLEDFLIFQPKLGKFAHYVLDQVTCCGSVKIFCHLFKGLAVNNIQHYSDLAAKFGHKHILRLLITQFGEKKNWQHIRIMLWAIYHGHYALLKHLHEVEKIPLYHGRFMQVAVTEKHGVCWNSEFVHKRGSHCIAGIYGNLNAVMLYGALLCGNSKTFFYVKSNVISALEKDKAMNSFRQQHLKLLTTIDERECQYLRIFRQSPRSM